MRDLQQQPASSKRQNISLEDGSINIYIYIAQQKHSFI